MSAKSLTRLKMYGRRGLGLSAGAAAHVAATKALEAAINKLKDKKKQTGGRRKGDFALAHRLLTLKRARELKQDGGGLSNYLHGKTVKHLFANNLKGSLARAYANAVVNKTGKKALKGLAARAVPLAGVGLGLGLGLVSGCFVDERRKRQKGGVTSNTNRQAIRNAENAM